MFAGPVVEDQAGMSERGGLRLRQSDETFNRVAKLVGAWRWRLQESMYSAPELGDRQVGYDNKVDIFSWALVTVLLWLGSDIGSGSLINLNDIEGERSAGTFLFPVCPWLENLRCTSIWPRPAHTICKIVGHLCVRLTVRESQVAVVTFVKTTSGVHKCKLLPPMCTAE
jgi:hypothetical protein